MANQVKVLQAGQENFAEGGIIYSQAQCHKLVELNHVNHI